MNLRIIGIHFLPCCSDSFPPCVPSHFLHLIASERKVNNRHRAPAVSRWTTSTDLILFWDVCKFSKGRISSQSLAQQSVSLYHLLSGKKNRFSFLHVLALGSPSAGPDFIELLNNIRWLWSFSQRSYGLMKPGNGNAEMTSWREEGRSGRAEERNYWVNRLMDRQANTESTSSITVKAQTHKHTCNKLHVITLSSWSTYSQCIPLSSLQLLFLRYHLGQD